MVRTGAEAVRNHYARVAAGYGARRSRGMAGWLRQRERAAVLDLLDAGPGDRVLDVGCGDGGLGVAVKARGALAVGVDIVAGMALSARRLGVDSAVADMAALCFRPAFEWAAWIGSSEFAADLDEVSRQVAAALRPGGRLVMLFPRRNWLGLALVTYHRLDGVSMHLRSRQAISRSLERSGFDPPDTWRRCAAAWVCRARLGGTCGACQP